MFETKNSIFINRPPQDVFNVITDPDKISIFQNMTESVEWSSNSSPGVGSTMNVIAKFLGRKIESDIEIAAWEPPHRVDFKFVNGPSITPLPSATNPGEFADAPAASFIA